MICSDCGKDHSSQRKDYPLGAVVKARHDMTGPTYDIQAGTQGRVVGHCDDGRAIIDFGGIGSHTFHIPSGYIEIDKLATLRAELARVTEERDELRAGITRALRWIHYPMTAGECEQARAFLHTALSSTSTPAAPPETANGE